jgi:parafibromin
MKDNRQNASTKKEESFESTITSKPDPDLASYFLVRQHSSDAGLSVSPKYAIKHWSGQSKSQLSEDSSRGQRGVATTSDRSSMSGPSKSQYISEWNEKNTDAVITPESWNLDFHRPADPPRPPKPGMEWVWFPQGYWAERVPPGIIQSKHSSRPKWWNRTPETKTPSPAMTERSPMKKSSITTPKFEIPRTKINDISRKTSSVETGSGRRRSSSHKSVLSMQLGGFTFRKSKPTNRDNGDALDAPLGLYCRTKKNIKELLLDRSKMVRSVVFPPSSMSMNTDEVGQALEEARSTRVQEHGLKSRTTMLLEETSNYLIQQQREREYAEKGYRGATPRSIASLASFDGRFRRGFGLAPWHRRNSHESFLTATSSVRALLMGKTPSATPVSEGRYMGPAGQSFVRGM